MVSVPAHYMHAIDVLTPTFIQSQITLQQALSYPTFQHMRCSNKSSYRITGLIHHFDCIDRLGLHCNGYIVDHVQDCCVYI
jgi:hypothetical protein